MSGLMLRRRSTQGSSTDEEWGEKNYYRKRASDASTISSVSSGVSSDFSLREADFDEEEELAEEDEEEEEEDEDVDRRPPAAQAAVASNQAATTQGHFVYSEVYKTKVFIEIKQYD
jgi:hypothetical protein